MKTHELVGGSWISTGIAPTRPDRDNFVIVCDFGDWSGFRTLQECLNQIPRWQDRRPGFFRICR